ncbi:WD40 repeat [Arabidopsis thaliana x Arabidopsis arenosa]|uniref:WD40 repeat n=1 Tax=Arabidopsis thaliana x Arabidopsis arenosa TaxID=1240361 RepID=A0A8T2BJ67_9BRAS|nr:WD40 repeat [Arabidopsis thaliana x Arabidopsis arenosa]
MDIFDNSDLEYLVDEFHAGFDDDEPFGDVDITSDSDSDFMDSDFDFELTQSKMNNDTSALEARNGKDIQGIPWESMNYTRDRYRENRLLHYKNFESLFRSREELYKDCLQVEKGKNFYDFQFNTRLVKSTIAHFQLRNLVWATSKHDVYFMNNYSLMHWSSLLQRGKEVLNVAKPIVPTMKQHGSLSQSVSRVQISTMAVKDDLIVAGGFQGELICKKINEPEVAFCTKLTSAENDITNSVDIYNAPSGSLRVMTANNDCTVRLFDASNFALLNSFAFDWSVNNISTSPDGKLVAVLGDSPECLLADTGSGKVIHGLKGHLDYSFSSAWHPNGQILATGNQDTTCRLWDVRNLSQSLKVLKGNMGAIRALRFTSDGRFLAMAEPADFVHLFDTEAGYSHCQEIDLFGEIAGISFSPDTEGLFVGVADRTYGSLLEFNRKRNHSYVDSIF